MEERKFVCANCRKEIDFFKLVYLPGREIFDPISGMRFDTGNNYCETCYKEITQHNVGDSSSLLKKSYGVEQIDSVRDLNSKKNNINLIVKVINKNESKVEKNGRKLRLCKFKVKDESGETKFILWEKIIDLVSVGDTLLIKNGFLREYGGENLVTLGKEGILTNLEKD